MPELLSFIIIGFFFGFKHAFDADHIAAVSILGGQSGSKKTAMLRGIYWAFGHTLVLFLLGIFVFFLGLNIPEKFSNFFEFIISIFLIILGCLTIWQYFLRRTQLNGNVGHIHPPLGFHVHNAPSFFVGMIHGLAGSAAIFAIFLSTFKSAFFGLAVLLAFGFGTIVGMALVSFAVGIAAWRFRKYAGFLAGIFSGFTGIILLFSKLF